MSVSRKVLRKMKKVMGVISTIPVLTACSSQISYAGKKIFKVTTTLESGKNTKLESWTDSYNGGTVRYKFDYSSGTLTVSGNGPIRSEWKNHFNKKLMGAYNKSHNRNSRKDRICTVVIEPGITGIQEDALSRLRYLNSVTIPDSVTNIDRDAFFHCISLENIIIPESVTNIGRCAFGECTSLENITIPKSVTSIGESAFVSCTSLKNITIPNSVTRIGSGAFSGCKSLEEITIPNSVTSIGSGAFTGTSLKSITIPYSVTSIDEWAFAYCKELQEIIFANRGCTRDWANIAHVLRYIPRENDEASFSSRKKAFNLAGFVYGFLQNCKVGKYAFYTCPKLRKVMILMNVVFADEAFKKCNEIFRKLEGSKGIHGTFQLDDSMNLDT